MRKTIFANGEYYHIYNRGVDKREIFADQWDMDRFFKSLIEFNTINPIGSIYENSFKDKPLGGSASKLVDFISYCLNPNHYHFILRQTSDDGIKKFMHRLGGGYTMYFNEKHKRSGSLFQGRFKAIHINSNEYLSHLGSYVNLNDRVHKLGGSASKSSWNEYAYNQKGICNKDVILNQFNSIDQYKDFAEKSLQYIIERKDAEKMILE